MNRKKNIEIILLEAANISWKAIADHYFFITESLDLFLLSIDSKWILGKWNIINH